MSIQVIDRAVEAHHFRVSTLKCPVYPSGLHVHLARIKDLIQEALSLDVPLSIVSSEHISLAHPGLSEQTHLDIKVALGLGNDGGAGPVADQLVHKSECFFCLRKLYCRGGDGYQGN